jgi:predicted nucleic acid-binding protein
MIGTMERFVLDANVFLGFLNKKDAHHDKCLAFFREIDNRHRKGERVQAVVPMHAAIEVNVNIRRKKRNRTWTSFPPLQIVGPELYPMDLHFLNQIQQKGLYDKFDKLKSSDAIYAMVSYIEGIPLVTADKDFEKVRDIIDVRFI